MMSRAAFSCMLALYAGSTADALSACQQMVRGEIELGSSPFHGRTRYFLIAVYPEPAPLPGPIPPIGTQTLDTEDGSPPLLFEVDLSGISVCPNAVRVNARGYDNERELAAGGIPWMLFGSAKAALGIRIRVVARWGHRF